LMFRCVRMRFGIPLSNEAASNRAAIHRFGGNGFRHLCIP
jgi:hypothetical protein